MSEPLRIGTRGSQLALWQANAVKSRIETGAGVACRIVTIKTTGDRLQEAPLSEVGGKRLFVKEIEDALLRNEIDLAVHSSKDMPAVLPEGLAIEAVLPREDPRDAVVLPVGAADWLSDVDSIETLVSLLGQAPTIGTGSVRRIAQLTRLIPAARFVSIRGNLDTRLRKVDDGGYDALVLAAAGLRRLGFAHRISFALPVDACLPAPGQGIVAIEVRQQDDAARRAVEGINDPDSGTALLAERSLVEALGGGCQTPIGALAAPAPDGQLELSAAVVSLDGSLLVRAHATGTWDEAARLGARVAAKLLDAGAAAILADAERHRTQARVVSEE